MEAADLLVRCTFPPPGTAVDCAVSGGPDSLALLVLAVEADLTVTAWHVDHGLRPGSNEEGARVAAVAASLGAAAVSVTAVVDDGPNLEERAREARLGALPDGVLTGHTADDQAETVLLNLLRGSGVHGAAGIGDPGRRPLLDLRRSETLALCDARGLDPLDDPMNADPRFVRNRIRHEVLPLLAEVSDEAVALLDGLVEGVDPTDARKLARLTPELARLALRGWLTGLLDGRPPDAAAVDRVLDVAGGLGRATEVAGGLRIERSKGRLRPVPEGGRDDGGR